MVSIFIQVFPLVSLPSTFIALLVQIQELITPLTLHASLGLTLRCIHQDRAERHDENCIGRGKIGHTDTAPLPLELGHVSTVPANGTKLSSILSQNPSYEFIGFFHIVLLQKETNKSSACIPFLSFCKQLYGEWPFASSKSLFLEYPNSCQATPKLNHNVVNLHWRYTYMIYGIRVYNICYIHIYVYIFTSYICIHILRYVLYGDWNVWALWSKRLYNPHLFVAVQLACRTAGMGAMRPTSCMVPTAATRSIKHAIETSWPCHEYLFETWASLSNIRIRLILFDK